MNGVLTNQAFKILAWSFLFFFLGFLQSAEASPIIEFGQTSIFSSDVEDSIGASVISLGDLNGDGNEDWAVGTDWHNNTDGAVYILFTDNDGNVASTQIINPIDEDFPSIVTKNKFGYSLENMGDLDGDGVSDIAVGEIGNDAGGCLSQNQFNNCEFGAVYILFLNSDGTVKASVEIANDSGGMEEQLPYNGQFGKSLANLGDVDADGLIEFAVGGNEYFVNQDGNRDKGGVVYLLQLDENFEVTDYSTIGTGVVFENGPEGGNVPFAATIENLSDSNNDGLIELLVGNPVIKEESSGQNIGGFYIFNLNSDLTVDSFDTISDNINGLQLSYNTVFGHSVKRIDTEESSEVFVLVGATGADSAKGAIYLLEILEIGEEPIVTLVDVIDSNLIGNDLDALTGFGRSVAVGESKIAIGATGYDTPTVNNAGAVYFVDYTIISSNTTPILNPIGNQTISEGDTLTFTVTASDPDGDDITLSATNLPDDSIFDPQTGIFTWNTDFTDAGNYPDIEFTATDDGEPIELAVELITITVGDVNRAPVITNPGPQELLEEETITFNITATDPDGDNTTLSADNLPTGATFTNGTFSWTPTLNQEGVYAVTFTATDDGTPVESASTTVLITVGDNPTPTEQAEDLVEDVINIDIPQNVENAYLANLQKVEQFIETGKIQAAINQLEAFINKVEQDYQQGIITVDVYNNLIAAAENLIADIEG